MVEIVCDKTQKGEEKQKRAQYTPVNLDVFRHDGPSMYHRAHRASKVLLPCVTCADVFPMCFLCVSSYSNLKSPNLQELQELCHDHDQDIRPTKMK